MLNNLISEATTMTFGESLIVFFLGMVTIFVVLIILVGFLQLSKYLDKKDKGKDSANNNSINTQQIEEGEDYETVVAISSAIALFLEAQQISAPFKIKKIKRIK